MWNDLQMQLISLKSNQTSFRPVLFKNKVGLNIIVAEQNIEEADYKKNSFNGVGKSLLMAIIQFCLGSSKKDSFKSNLSGWEFILDFEINGNRYESCRSADKQNIIRLNGENLKLSNFNQKLGELLFDIPENTSSLSFRALFPFFYRPRR